MTLDVVLQLMGFMFALAWQLHPFLIVPALSPLVLMYRSLAIPRLKREAQIDHKTGLWNVRHFRDVLEFELDRAERSHRPLPIIMADLDLLRDVNNTYGHLAGDAVLADIGRIIRETIRDYHMAARFGGEEFCIALPETTVDEARQVAEDIRHVVAAHQFHAPNIDEPIHVTISLGVASFPEDGDLAASVIHAADLALYQAKYQGRNRVEMSSTAPSSISLIAGGVDLHARVPAAANVDPPIHRETGNSVPDIQRGALASVQAQGHSWALRLLVGVALITAAGISISGLIFWDVTDWRAIIAFSILAFVVQLFQIPMYGESSVSVSMAIAFGSALIGGIPGVVFASTAIAIAHWIRKRSALYKSLFNWSTHVLAGSAPAYIVHSFNVDLALSGLLILAIPVLLSALLYYFIDTGLIASAVALASGATIGDTWRKQFRWLANQYIVGCTIGLFAAVAYAERGVVFGVMMFSLPVFTIYYAQKQYVSHTRESLRELQRMNGQLVQANHEIETAASAILELNADLFVTLATVLDARDPYVRNHSIKVAEFSTAIAVELGLTEQEIEHIYQAAMLHDIGKLGISEQILHKPSRLTDEEYDIIKEHVRIGADLIEGSRALRHLAPTIRYHHERWDGCGYLSGLQGEAIPLTSRILAVADSVEAMAADRPYHRAMSLPAIVNELKRNAGSQFDPQVANVFVELLARKDQQFIPTVDAGDWKPAMSADNRWRPKQSQFEPVYNMRADL